MIVSHRHKFIFIRAPKTASTSLQVALARQCGPDDIVTDVRLEKKELTTKKTKYDGAKLAKQHRSNNPDRINPHVFPVGIIKHFGREIWDNYYKIVVVRNPWDQAFSEHNFSRKVKLQREFGHDARQSWQYYFPNGEDFGNTDTGRYLIFEDLASEFKRLCGDLGLRHDELPGCKTTYRDDETRDYRRFMDDEMRSEVSSAAKKIIDYFGYEFDSPGLMPRWRHD